MQYILLLSQLTPPRSAFISLVPQLCVSFLSFFKTTYWFKFVLAMYFWVWDHLLVHRDLPGVTTSKETHFPYSRHHLLTVVPHLGTRNAFSSHCSQHLYPPSWEEEGA